MAMTEARTITGWELGFQTLEAELDETELEVAGTLPSDLDGVLYRVGPARHDVYGDRYKHWFDGDGMVHALRLGGGQASYRNRFVATKKKAEEDAARARMYAGFGTPPAGRGLTRMRRAAVRANTANTNVVFHHGRLLALWEAGRPWRLDPHTLDTIGEDDLGGALAPNDSISAHPKLDPATGEMWNFGIGYGPKTTFSLYRTTAEGVTDRVTKIKLPFGGMVHDFALTATKAVVVMPPIALPWIPVALLTGRRSYGQSLRWQPGRGTPIAVIDRATAETRWYQTDGFMMFHTVNAWDEGDDVVVDLCAYPDDSIMRLISEVMVGQSYPASAFAERLRMTAAGTVERRRLSDTPVELPRVAGRSLTGAQTRIYGPTNNEEGHFIGVPAAIDPESGKAQLTPMTAGQFAGELVPVTKSNATGDDDVWLLTLVLDADARRSELWVLDGADVAAPPVAVVALPHVVPFGFHGNWVRSERLASA